MPKKIYNKRSSEFLQRRGRLTSVYVEWLIQIEISKYPPLNSLIAYAGKTDFLITKNHIKSGPMF